MGGYTLAHWPDTPAPPKISPHIENQFTLKVPVLEPSSADASLPNLISTRGSGIIPPSQLHNAPLNLLGYFQFSMYFFQFIKGFDLNKIKYTFSLYFSYGF